jgi:hypothetical protein
MYKAVSIERVASSMFVLGATPGLPQRPRSRSEVSLSRHADLPNISSQATVGRNAQFNNLTVRDREQLGGIEYRSLKLLLKIVTGNKVPSPCQPYPGGADKG